MLKRSAFIIIPLLVLFGSCNFSKGVKKDLATGQTSSYTGFALDDIFLAYENGTRIRSNVIRLGDRLAVTVTGVSNFSEIEGKVFPGCRIILTDKNKNELLNLPDAFSDMTEGTTPALAKTLRASLTTGDPMTAGETYLLSVRFFDKNNPKNEIKSTVDLIMKE